MSARTKNSIAADSLKDCIRDLDEVSARIARIIAERNQPTAPAAQDEASPADSAGA